MADDETGGAEWCGGDGTGRTAGDNGGCFGTVLEWFWEHKIHGQNTEKNVWKMEDDKFFYYLRNKKKIQKAIKSKKMKIYFFYLYMKMKWWRNEKKKKHQEDKKTGFTNFKLQDPYENLNLICEYS